LKGSSFWGRSAQDDRGKWFLKEEGMAEQKTVVALAMETKFSFQAA
jgi:hypothetical protein